MTERQARPDETHWRDQKISEYHRQWGFNCPAVDIDFLLIEYSAGKAKALVEYKHEGAPLAFKGDKGGANKKTYQAMTDLCDRACLPFFVVEYNGDFTEWKVHPINRYALQWIKITTLMTEQDYITLLYSLRGIPVPPTLIDWVKKNRRQPDDEV